LTGTIRPPDATARRASGESPWDDAQRPRRQRVSKDNPNGGTEDNNETITPAACRPAGRPRPAKRRDERRTEPSGSGPRTFAPAQAGTSRKEPTEPPSAQAPQNVPSSPVSPGTT